MTETRPRRRQARGKRRIEQILDAASRVFARGYASATTNAIAAEAGISPGSLYQYFPNKEAIAEALEGRFAGHIRAAQDATAEDLSGLPIAEAVDRLVDPIVAYGLAAPGFHAVFAERRLPDHLAASTHELHSAVVGRVDAILRAHDPDMSAGDRARRTMVAVQICRATMPVVVAASEADRPALVRELKTVLERYLSAPAAAAEPGRAPTRTSPVS